MDSGILYWFLSRTRDRNANNIAFNGSTTFAQSNDIVAKTAYNGTVSGNVTIGSDASYSYILGTKAGSPIVNFSTLLNTVFNTQEFEVHFLMNIPSSETGIQTDIFSNSLAFNAMRLLKGSDDLFNWYTRQSAGGSDLLKSSNAIVHDTRFTVVLKATGGIKTMYINNVSKGTQSITNRASLTGNQRMFVSNSTGYGTSKIGMLRVYSTALTDAQRTTELALGQKQTARKDCVLEILPNYFAGTTASPTTIYDVKAFTPATPVVIQTTFQLGADGVNTAFSQPLAQTPYRYVHIRTTLNALVMRKDGPGFASDTYQIGNGNRSTHTAVLTAQILNGSIVTTVFIDGVKVDTDTTATLTRTKYTDYLQIGRVLNSGTGLYTGTISNTKVFIGTITDVEGVAMSSGITVNPVNATLFTQPRRLPPYGTTMTDVSGNGYDFTLTP